MASNPLLPKSSWMLAYSPLHYIKDILHRLIKPTIWGLNPAFLRTQVLASWTQVFTQWRKFLQQLGASDGGNFIIPAILLQKLLFSFSFDGRKSL